MKIALWSSAIFLFSCMASSGAIAAVDSVSHLQVRVTLGAHELSAGSVLELRIYEAGRSVRRLPLTHGEAWPRDSTRLIPVSLNEDLDPRNVSRFAIYYRAASPSSLPLEVVEADVELPASQPATPQQATERMLNATVSGVIAQQGELASEERDTKAMTCSSDADCDDHRSCNGHERCSPRAAGADARGCVKGLPVVCPVNQVCSENHGCRGAASIAAK